MRSIGSGGKPGAGRPKGPKAEDWQLREGGGGGSARSWDAPLKRRGRDHDRDRGDAPKKEFRSKRGAPTLSHGKEGRPKPRAYSKLRATVDKNRKGFGFLIFDGYEHEDMFVPPREAEALFHGDRVEVTTDARGGFTRIEVLEHRFRELVGRFSPHPMGTERGGWVIYEQKKTREEVWLPEIDPKFKLKPNDWMRVKLVFHEEGPFTVTGLIEEVFGAELPPRVDVGMIAAEFNLIEEHTKEADAEARTHRLEVPGKDLEGRVDLREMPFITIDGETARDFDDAVYVEKKGSRFVLWVGIADVSHYVTDGSVLDKEARSRGTSVYFPERAFHMLPRALSENLCSLRPDEPRLAMVAKMEFDASGKRHSTELMEAVILSKRRATYTEIQAEKEANENNPDWEYRPHAELYSILRKARSQRGSLDFEFPEAEMNVKPTGEVVSITIRERQDAHRLIEEFMIAANEAVTVWMMEREWPFVYRVHEEPSAQSLEKFQKLAANVGVKVSLDQANSPKVLSEVIARLDGHPAQTMLNMALLRSMKQAVYSSVHGIHFGLASTGYTHFTSPIRRYPDLVVHRLLRWALQAEQRKRPGLGTGRDKLEKELASITEHCSYRERLAADAEREAIRLKQVRVMIPLLGDEFEAKIIGMIENGLFVQLTDPYVEGLISKESMGDDFYQFNEERMIFYGKRKKRTFKIGDEVKVRCVRADLDRRQIDFQLL